MARGKLRIYLGAAPGVGKTYAMLNEGWRRKQRGTDVVVGYVETHGRPNTAAQLRDLDVMPRRTIRYRDQDFEEMDVDVILARHPAVVLVDELAHTNVPGSHNAKRWQDVEELLAAGIEVITTINIQHLESLNDVVQGITGIVQRETIPDWVVRAADQVELVDMAPEALRRRMAHGNIYTAERVDAALGNYFRVGNLSALRELALLWVADQVDEGLHDYRERHGIAQPWETRERVIVALTGSPQGERLIRRAARMAARARAELVGVHIRAVDGLARPGTDLLEDHRRLLLELSGRYEEITGSDVAKALADFAMAENATQLILGATQRSRWSEMLHGSVINQVIRAADGIDVHIISQRADGTDEEVKPTARLPRLPTRGRLAPLPRRRVAGGWVAALIGLPLLALTMVPLRGTIGVVGNLPVLLVGAIAVAAIGGVWPGVAGAVMGFALGDWLFIPPVHTFTIGRAGDAVAGVTFLLVAVMVSALVDQSARRRLETTRAKVESEALARLAGGALATGAQALPSLLAELRATFGVDAVAILTPDDDEAPAGRDRTPASTGAAQGSTRQAEAGAGAGPGTGGGTRSPEAGRGTRLAETGGRADAGAATGGGTRLAEAGTGGGDAATGGSTPVAGIPARSTAPRRRWVVQASAGSPVPARPEDAQFDAALGGGAVLVLAGEKLAADDQRLLSAFVAQLRLAREQGRLLAQAASAEQLSETNELRTALLAAVSHDLRTPLASIKAAATSLLSDEVQWPPETVTSFCETINDEADRLNTLVGNLLDMSRLQTGVLHLDVRPVGLDEVVYAALASLSRDAERVTVEVPETLPQVVADPALLERAVANLVDNALNWSPPELALRVEAGRCNDRIDLRVVDRGPGIPPAERDAVFRPFQRLGDGGSATKDGVGLGLAVAKGFVEAMGGELTLEDTPGGGLTSVISLPAAPEPEPGPDHAPESADRQLTAP